MLRSTGKKHEKQNGADQTCAIYLSKIGMEKGFFYSVNVLGKGRCAALYRAASSDRRERP
jgi:hypothetical protein